MHNDTEGVPHPVSDPVSQAPACETFELTRDAGGSTCGDCGAVLQLVTKAEAVDQALKQLIELRPECLYCHDQISHCDFLVAWPAADVVAHFGCYAKAQQLVKATDGAAS